MYTDELMTEINVKKVHSSSSLSNKGLLVVLSTNNLGLTHIVDRFPFIIGRQDDSNFVINDSLVSKKHCAIYYENNKFYIEDLGSRNKTFVNGKELKKKTEMFYGDKVSVGSTIMRFYLEEKE